MMGENEYLLNYRYLKLNITHFINYTYQTFNKQNRLKTSHGIGTDENDNY